MRPPPPAPVEEGGARVNLSPDTDTLPSCARTTSTSTPTRTSTPAASSTPRVYYEDVCGGDAEVIVPPPTGGAVVGGAPGLGLGAGGASSFNPNAAKNRKRAERRSRQVVGQIVGGAASRRSPPRSRSERPGSKCGGASAPRSRSRSAGRRQQHGRRGQSWWYGSGDDWNSSWSTAAPAAWGHSAWNDDDWERGSARHWQWSSQPWGQQPLSPTVPDAGGEASSGASPITAAIQAAQLAATDEAAVLEPRRLLFEGASFPPQPPTGGGGGGGGGRSAPPPPPAPFWGGAFPPPPPPGGGGGGGRRRLTATSASCRSPTGH